MTVTAGIDVGSNAVKAVLMQHGDAREILSSSVERIRKRDIRQVIGECWRHALDGAGVAESEIGRASCRERV